MPTPTPESPSHPLARPSAVLVAGVLLLLASPGLAAGGLEILPDFEPGNPRSWPGSPFVQLLVIFGVLVYPTSRFLFTPLLQVLDERRERIEGARARSEDIRKQAEDIHDRYEVGLRGARGECEVERREQIDAARAEQVTAAAHARQAAESEVGAARSEVAQELESSRRELRAQAEDLAREAASRVLGRPLS